MQWRTTGSDEPWRVCWSRESGAHYAPNYEETVAQELGSFPTEHDVTAALPEWEETHYDPDDLDWTRQWVGPQALSPTLKRKRS